MTPMAREELHRYCEQKRKERKGREWSMTDKTDLYVALACTHLAMFVLGLVCAL